MILEKCLTKTFKSSTAFIKAAEIKRDESDSQSLTKIFIMIVNRKKDKQNRKK